MAMKLRPSQNVIRYQRTFRLQQVIVKAREMLDPSMNTRTAAVEFRLREKEIVPLTLVQDTKGTDSVGSVVVTIRAGCGISRTSHHVSGEDSYGTASRRLRSRLARPGGQDENT